MATMITSECINCGACEPECPNTAIYQGGVEWELNGVKHPAIANEIFYIVPEKCTECVGFFDHEACAAVCPVDCCVPNPDIPETEDVLIARAKQLHPDREFGADFPSRFRAGNGADKAAAPKPTEASPAATQAAPKPAPAPAPPAAVAAATAPLGVRIEKPIAPPRKPRELKSFPTELPMSFEEAAALARQGKSRTRTAVKLAAALAQPILGALPDKQKRTIEKVIGDRRFFTAAGATGVNALHNLLLYPIIVGAFAALVFDKPLFSNELRYWIFLGVTIATVETIWRMREGFMGMPSDRIHYRSTFYGLPLAPVVGIFLTGVRTGDAQGTVGQDGFRNLHFDEKLERERRYGEVYRLEEHPNGFLLRFEFPRRVPTSAVKEELGVPDEMPDYDYDIALSNGYVTIKGRVTDPKVRKIAAVSPAFPPDFSTRIKLPAPVSGFKHRFAGKDLEVALVKRT